MNSPTVVHLFAGSGGCSLGFQRAGFRSLGSFDFDPAACRDLEQPWPRLDGETPDPAHHWQRAGFDDAGVAAWLEVGVPWASKAAELADIFVAPCEVSREFDIDVTLGLAFARGELTLEQLLAEVDRC